MSSRTVRFIPVKDGDVVDLGDSGLPGISGQHKLLGFKPGPGPQPRGWIVVLVARRSKEVSKAGWRRDIPRKITREPETA